MEKYSNLSNDSNIEAYEIGPDFIRVSFFGTRRIYTYSYRKAGSNHVEQMKSLARAGRGLNSYINRKVKYLYD